MPGFSKNPLFRRAGKKVRAQARSEWNKTTAAKAVRQVEAAMRGSSPAGGGTQVRKALQQWGKSGLNGAARTTLLSSDFGTMVREVGKYARMGGSIGRQVSQFLGAIGPIGTLINSVLSRSGNNRSSGVDGDIQSALDFLDATAPDLLSDKGRKRSTLKKPTARRKSSEVAEQIELAKQFLEGNGFEVKPLPGKSGGGAGSSQAPQVDDPTPTSKEKTFPGGVPKTTSKGKSRKVVDLDFGGSKRRFAVTHPIVTKKMIPTPESSNVFSYSYDIDTWTLYIRFQSHMVYGTAGSLYSYSSVPPSVFLKMYNAPSKGTFIWDNIRIRGTISGHRYDYKLTAITQNYVPRKATMGASGETLVQRTVKVRKVSTGKVMVLKSGGNM